MLESAFACEETSSEIVVLDQGQLHTRMGLILSGDLSLIDPDLGLEIKLSPGEMFGFGATPPQQLTTWQAKTCKETSIAWLQPDVLVDICKKHGELAYFFSSLPIKELKSSADLQNNEAVNLLSTPIRSLVKREPVTLSPSTTIQAAAELMRDLGISSVFLFENNQLIGLLTDRDLRSRVVAAGIDINRPVRDIATLSPMTVTANSPAFEVLLLMAQHNIHHMPVMDGDRILGMVTTTDLTKQHSSSAVYLVGDIYQQTSIEGLKQISHRIRSLQQQLAAADATAYSTGHIITSVTDTITIQLIKLAESTLGVAPIPYVWVAAGSQARFEQTAKSDQDNCLVLDDAFDELKHGAYFKAFSKFVCDGLAQCGYIHCPGEMMAMTDQWRQPHRIWVEYFSKWIEEPKPMALMLTCVFFDLRAIHGDIELLDSLRQNIVRLTKSNSLFLAHMVSNALKHRPPLGMFGQITLIKGSENPGSIDMKHAGIVPIVDLARVYALAAGIAVANTHDRLELSAKTSEVSNQASRDLRDALEFLCKLRIDHQARQITQGIAPDNFLVLEELSNFERSHLKNAFNIVQTLQGVLQQRYSGGRF